VCVCDVEVMYGASVCDVICNVICMPLVNVMILYGIKYTSVLIV
jgi:hypothetical protein